MFFKRWAAFLVCAALLAGLSGSALAVEYPDVSAEHWAYTDVQRASELGLFQGLEDGSFRPGDKLDRASFLTILYRMFGWSEPAPAQPSFSDVPADHWAYPAVEAALAHGVLDQGDTLHPSAYVTRQDMAVMLVRALGYETLANDLAAAGKADSFPDVTACAGHIAVAAAIGLTNGVPDPATGETLFQPQAFATRDQAAAMLVRVYERYCSKLDWLHGFYAFASYGQIGLTDTMEAVSVGWARLEAEPGAAPWINHQRLNGNDWVQPADSQLVTDYFQGNGTPCNLNVYADTTLRDLPDGSRSSALEALLDSPQIQAQAVEVLCAAAEDYAGLTIDFEGLKTDTYRAAFAQFMAGLRAALPAEKTLYVCVPPDDWYKGYDFRALGEVCDKVILMAHDYQWTSVPPEYIGTREPNSPVTPFARVFQALQAVTHPDTGVQDRSKLALAISFGSAGFEVDENGLLASDQIYHPSPSTIAQRLAQPDTVVTYDWSSRNPCALYTTTDGPALCRLWYEDARSVADKLTLARMFGITGVSLWRLGNVPNDPDIPYYDVFSAVLSQR